MLMIFYRRFYILLFLVWLLATGSVFVLTVWGDFDTFITVFQQVAKVEQGERAAGQPAVTESEVVPNETERVMHRVRRTEDAARTEIVREVLKGLSEAEQLKIVTTAATEVPAEKRKAVAPKEPQAPRTQKIVKDLTAVTFTESEDRLTAHLSTTGSVEKITAYWMDTPTRIVVDLRGNWKNLAPRIHRFTNSFMYRAIIGMHADRLRIVFKFEDQQAPLGDQPQFVPTANGVDIVITNPGH